MFKSKASKIWHIREMALVSLSTMVLNQSVLYVLIIIVSMVTEMILEDTQEIGVQHEEGIFKGDNHSYKAF